MHIWLQFTQHKTEERLSRTQAFPRQGQGCFSLLLSSPIFVAICHDLTKVVYDKGVSAVPATTRLAHFSYNYRYIEEHLQILQFLFLSGLFCLFKMLVISDKFAQLFSLSLSPFHMHSLPLSAKHSSIYYYAQAFI